jgi:XRE family transcriptional regulator, stress-response regulator
MVLLRHLLGDALRRLRQRQGRTLREVSAAARVSLGYLSEVERGQKEASSELLAAICSALGAPLSQVFREVSDNFALAELQNEPVLAGVREPALDAPASVGMDTPETPQAFSGAAQQIRLAPGRELGTGTGAVLDAVQLPPGQKAAFDDEVARRIRDVTDMIPV